MGVTKCKRSEGIKREKRVQNRQEKGGEVVKTCRYGRKMINMHKGNGGCIREREQQT